MRVRKLTDFEIRGPIEVPHQKAPGGSGKLIDKSGVKSFWGKPESAKIAQKQGCYIFALRAAKGYVPWYVGKATKSMKQECFTTEKLNKYNSVLFKGQKGTPVLFFVERPGSRKYAPKTVIGSMERELIQDAYRRNSDLVNVQNTKNLPAWTIKGVFQSAQGKPSMIATVFGKMMGLK